MNIPTKTFNGPEWAYGCEACIYGIVAAPEIVPVVNLSECRAVQAHEDMILFCTCRAGFMYRQCLRRVYGAIGMETRRNILAHINAAMLPPTVHYAAPSPPPTVPQEASAV